MKNQDLTICCLQEIQFKYKDTHRSKVKGWKAYAMLTLITKKPGMIILVSDKVDF